MTIHFHQDFTRAQMQARLGEAEAQRHGRHVATSRRLARRAARAEQRAAAAMARL